MIWLGITGLLLVAVVVRARRRRSRRAAPLSQFRVEFDEAELAVVCPDTGRRVLKWTELTRVGIRTTAGGPWAPSVFWGFHDRSGQAWLVLPGGAAGEGALLRELERRLPGLKHEQISRALASTVDAGFIVWEREPSEDAPGGLLH